MPSCTAPTCTAPTGTVPSAAADRGTMHGATVPSHAGAHATAVPSAAATTVPSAAASRQRRRSDRCSADCDRRCETSHFRLTQFRTHGVLPKTRSPQRHEVRAVMFIPCPANQILRSAKRQTRKTEDPARVMNNNSCVRDCALLRSGIQKWNSIVEFKRGIQKCLARGRAACRCAALLSRRLRLVSSPRGAWRSRCRSTYCRRRSNGLRRLSRAVVHSRSRFAPCARP